MATQRETLIAAVRLLGHADAEVARRIGLKPPQFSAIAAGRENLPPEVAALLADLVGSNAQEAAARQMVENAREPRRSLLERAFFMLAVLGVAFASLGTPTATDAKATADNQTVTDIRWLDALYIVLHGLFVVGCARRLRAAARPALASWLFRRSAPALASSPRVPCGVTTRTPRCYACVAS